jgi:hypothetical protein
MEKVSRKAAKPERIAFAAWRLCASKLLQLWLGLEFWKFEIVSDFGFRFSDFLTEATLREPQGR